MNERIKNLWAKALRSGEFKQTTTRLHDGKAYCANGVLAALAMLEGQCTYNTGGKFDGKRKLLSYNILEWAEIDWSLEDKNSGQIKFVYKDKETSIAELNDKGLSFDEIADVIEKSWSNF